MKSKALFLLVEKTGDLGNKNKDKGAKVNLFDFSKINCV